MRKIQIWKNGEYHYPQAFGFEPNLRDYLLEDGAEHPCILVAPGGGYSVVSPTEGEIVAKAFNDLGYHCFVLTYTTNLLGQVPLMDQPMKDLARAIRLIRSRAAEWRVDPNRLIICGFSAAGHLCASVCDYYSSLAEENPKYRDFSCRPDAAILSYPVITSGPFTHEWSIRMLLGRDIYERQDAESQELLDRFSLEKHVHDQVPPVFLWQTVTDEAVPVENSYLYEAALREKGIRHAHHVFSRGHHGLSTATEAWARGEFGEPYTMEQTRAVVEALKRGKIPMPEEEKQQVISGFENRYEERKESAVPEVTVWPQLADQFLKTLWD